MSIVRRDIVHGVQVRAKTDDAAAPVLSGHTAVFNSWTDIGGMFRERIAPGAFDRALKESASKVDTAALFNHDSDNLLGRYNAGTLRLEETDDGLYYEVDLDMDSELGRQIARYVDRGELTGNSFAFTINKQSWDEDEETGEISRTITEVGELYDVGPVTFPAYPDAKIDAVRELREAGFELADDDDDDWMEFVPDPDLEELVNEKDDRLQEMLDKLKGE